MAKKLEKAGFLDPYIIAEIGVNHGGDFELAKKLIELAAGAGADAVKFQSYKADKLAAKNSSPYYWDITKEPAKSQHELFSRYDKFGENEYKKLASFCGEKNVDFLSTPFDNEAVDMLDPFMNYFKIASADITNIPLLRKISSKKKPVLLSTGASTEQETEAALALLEKAGVPRVYLLHCVLNYPTPPGHAQMALFDSLKEKFTGRALFGYSDHTVPDKNGSMDALDMAVLRGAEVIEKHFTHNKKLKGNDHYHAMDEHDLKKFTKKLSLYRTLYGGGERNLAWEAAAIKNARRRIIAAVDINRGSVIREEMLTALRSDTGIEVSQWDDITGKQAARPVKSGRPLTPEDIG